MPTLHWKRLKLLLQGLYKALSEEAFKKALADLNAYCKAKKLNKFQEYFSKQWLHKVRPT